MISISNISIGLEKRVRNGPFLLFMILKMYKNGKVKTKYKRISA
jgi:hypothetical protein